MRELLVNRDLNPLLTSLPAKFQRFEPHQIEAVSQVRDAFSRVPVVVLDAPTGSGKTLIAEAIRRMLRARAIYMCSDKALQDQFAGDFPYARVVKGRANYATELFPQSFHPESWMGHTSCEDCTWSSDVPVCALCSDKRSCPYEIAKKAALAANVAVLNSSYFLSECNGPGRFANRDLVIADECDTLEGVLMGHVSIEVSPRRMEKYGWSAPKLTVESDWLRWCEGAVEEVKPLKKEAEHVDDPTPQQIREAKYLGGLYENLRRIVTDMRTGTHSWVYTGDRERVSFKPARVTAYGESMMWKHGRRWLLMSASVISADEMLYSLGYRGAYESVFVPSTFPVKNRTVIVRPVANMTRKAEGKDDGKLLAAIRRVLLDNSDDRVVIHSVSYALTRKIADALRLLFPGREIISYGSGTEKESALHRYRTTAGAVLVAPSVDRGVDLPGDLCRVQIIVKCPFPYLGDKVVSARYHSGSEGKTWYSVQTVRTIVQMTGRGVRNQTDWCRTYILDSAFGDRVWSGGGGGRGLFPRWWQEALVWERP